MYFHCGQKLNLYLVAVFGHRSDLNASSGMAATLQQLARSCQWQPSIADHVGLCLERLAQPAEVLLAAFGRGAVVLFNFLLTFSFIAFYTSLLLSCMFSLQKVDLSAVFGLLVFARFPDVSITCLHCIKTLLYLS